MGLMYTMLGWRPGNETRPCGGGFEMRRLIELYYAFNSS